MAAVTEPPGIEGTVTGPSADNSLGVAGPGSACAAARGRPPDYSGDSQPAAFIRETTAPVDAGQPTTGALRGSFTEELWGILASARLRRHGMKRSS